MKKEKKKKIKIWRSLAYNEFQQWSIDSVCTRLNRKKNRMLVKDVVCFAKAYLFHRNLLKLEENNQIRREHKTSLISIHLPNFWLGWSIVGLDNVVLSVSSLLLLTSLVVLIDEIVSKYHFASPWRTLDFGYFRLIVDDCVHGFDFRQRERWIVPADAFVGLFDEVLEGFSDGVLVEIGFESSVKTGKWTKKKEISRFFSDRLNFVTCKIRVNHQAYDL